MQTPVLRKRPAPMALRALRRAPPAPLARTVLAAAALVGSAAAHFGCKEDAPRESAHRAVLLRGSFERVARAASGSAAILRSNGDYELKLDGVEVRDVGPVHVYLVGAPAVRSTSALDAVELKYDFGPLELLNGEQRIALPSEPDPQLRSVVLYNPKFGVVLASASLESQS